MYLVLLFAEILAFILLLGASTFARFQIAFAVAPLLFPAAMSLGLALEHVFLIRPRDRALSRSLCTLLSFLGAAGSFAAGVQLLVLLVECSTGSTTASGEQSAALYVSILCNDELTAGVLTACTCAVVFICESVRICLYSRSS